MDGRVRRGRVEGKRGWSGLEVREKEGTVTAEHNVRWRKKGGAARWRSE